MSTPLSPAVTYTYPLNKGVVDFTATAKSLQSCLTLCDPIPGILEARTLEWGAISFSWLADSLPLWHLGSPRAEIFYFDKVKFINSFFHGLFFYCCIFSNLYLIQIYKDFLSFLLETLQC